jgi:uncharacterized membrane protein YdjX (TVP38/TMEM64 family)
MSILYVILVLVVVGVIWWATVTILNAPGMIIQDPFKTVIKVVVIVFLILFVIQTFFGVVPGVPHLRL